MRILFFITTLVFLLALSTIPAKAGSLDWITRGWIRNNDIEVRVEPMSTPTQTPTPTKKQDRVCFCHNIQHNPETICTDDEGLINGHNGHIEDGKDSKGECESPTSTPTPTVTQTPCEECISPTVVPTETPQPTVVPTEAPRCHGESYTGEFCGWSPKNEQQKYSPSVCTNSLPKLAANPQYKKSDKGVTITWDHDGTNLSKFSLNFGYDKNNMPMGIPYLPKEAREITVLGLNPKVTNWFALCGYNGDSCQSCIVFDP